MIISKYFKKNLINKINLKEVIKNMGWLIVDKLIRALLGITVGAWVARYLGPSQYGEIAYCISFISLFQAIANLGMDGIVVRELSNETKNKNNILGTVFQLRIFAGVICWIISVILFIYISKEINNTDIKILILIGSTLLFQAADTVDLWFQSEIKSKRTVIAKIIGYMISNALKVFMVIMEMQLISFALIISIESLINAIALYKSYKKYPTNGKWNLDKKIAKLLILESWPYIVSGMSIMIYIRIDQIMIKNLLNNTSLGIYAAILPLSTIWNIIPIIICSSIAPTMAKKNLRNEIEFKNILTLIFRLMIISSLVISLTTVVFSSNIINILYGRLYSEASDILNIYIFTNIPIFLGVTQSLWMINKKKSHLSIIQTMSGAVMSIVGNLILIPIYGLKGAAFSAVISQLTSVILINYVFEKKLFLMQLGINGK